MINICQVSTKSEINHLENSTYYKRVTVGALSHVKKMVLLKKGNISG